MTAPSEAEIDVRWEMANYGRVVRDRHDESISLIPTKRHNKARAALEEIAACLVPDGVWTDKMQEADDGLDALMVATWEDVERRFKDWAARYPGRRAREAERIRASQAAAA